MPETFARRFKKEYLHELKERAKAGNAESIKSYPHNIRDDYFYSKKKQTMQYRNASSH